MTKDQRIQGLLESNNENVEKKRALKRMLEKCRDQFSFYAMQHLAKGTPEADAKAEVNLRFVADIEEALKPY